MNKRTLLFLLILLIASALLFMGAFDIIPDSPPVPELFTATEKNELSSATADFSFAVTGDMRWSHQPQVAIHKDIAKKNPLFVVNLGDVVRWAKTSLFDSYINHLKPFLSNQTRYFHTPGKHSHEHEIYSYSPEVFASYFGRSVFFIDVNAAWRFIVIDSSSISIPARQMEWLENILSDAQQKNLETVILSHCPPQMPEKGITHALDAVSTQKLQRLFKKYSIKAYFAAHMHTNTGYIWEDIPVFITALNSETWKTQPASYYLVEASEGNLNVSLVNINQTGQSITQKAPQND